MGQIGGETKGRENREEAVSQARQKWETESRKGKQEWGKMRAVIWRDPSFPIHQL